uniref:hypothetical protein n=1 Tax=Collinsella aerofaciens TaxID=74426 RepID=UPI003FEF1798
MSKTIVRPTLSLGNHIYLYRLLRDAIGCGKQTFMTQVEEALAAGDMTAYDLGFESTRELLEELDDCIKLTVFKGGRLYATVIANEAWDAALAKGEDKPKAAKGAKQSYKKKKRGEKDLKAVRPKHVKRPEPEAMVEAAPEPEPETEIEVAIEVTAEAETEIAATTDSEVISEQEATVELNEAPKSTTEEAADQPEPSAFQNSDVFGDEAEDDQSDEPADQDATESTPEPETPQPAISLTVVYDPENANAGITTMASTPIEAKPSIEAEDAPEADAKTETEDTSVSVEPTDSAVNPEPVPESVPVIESTSAPVPAPVPAPAAPTIPEDFPVDFATEVFCPGPLLHQLSTYLPYGADTLGIVGEYYWIARERGTIEAARNRASFPLRYTQAGERREVAVRIRRNTTGGLGSTWAIDKVEEPEQ